MERRAGSRGPVLRVATIYYLKCQISNKKLQGIQKNGKVLPIHWEKSREQKLPMNNQMSDFKVVIMNKVTELKESMLKKEVKESNDDNVQRENIIKDTEIIKRNQMKILELKSTITEIKNFLEGLNRRSKLLEEQKYS